MNVLEELIKDRNGVAEEIGELLSMRDSVNCDIAEQRDRLLELNKDIEATKEEEVKEAKEREEQYSKVLKGGDYSALAREYRRLDKELNEGRKHHWFTFKEDTKPLSEEGVRQQRREVGEKMLEIERRGENAQY